ncbi:MAG: hypothetical protein ABH883_09390, partial [Candidatus Omnitrophota bacterium]
MTRKNKKSSATAPGIPDENGASLQRKGAEIPSDAMAVIPLIRYFGYKKDVIEKFIGQVFTWRGPGGCTIRRLKEDLLKTRKSLEKKLISRKEAVEKELVVLDKMVSLLHNHISYTTDISDIKEILERKKSNCAGFTQIIFILSSYIGFKTDACIEQSVILPSFRDKSIVPRNNDTFIFPPQLPHIWNTVILSDADACIVDGAYDFIGKEKNIPPTNSIYYASRGKYTGKKGVKSILLYIRAVRNIKSGEPHEARHNLRQAIHLKPEFEDEMKARLAQTGLPTDYFFGPGKTSLTPLTLAILEAYRLPRLFGAVIEESGILAPVLYMIRASKIWFKARISDFVWGFMGSRLVTALALLSGLSIPVYFMIPLILANSYAFYRSHDEIRSARHFISGFVFNTALIAITGLSAPWFPRIACAVMAIASSILIHSVWNSVYGAISDKELFFRPFIKLLSENIEETSGNKLFWEDLKKSAGESHEKMKIQNANFRFSVPLLNATPHDISRLISAVKLFIDHSVKSVPLLSFAKKFFKTSHPRDTCLLALLEVLIKAGYSPVHILEGLKGTKHQVSAYLIRAFGKALGLSLENLRSKDCECYRKAAFVISSELGDIITDLKKYLFSVEKGPKGTYAVYQDLFFLTIMTLLQISVIKFGICIISEYKLSESKILRYTFDIYGTDNPEDLKLVRLKDKETAVLLGRKLDNKPGHYNGLSLS